MMRPDGFKCEFCDIILHSDLDVSKHLVGQSHSDNVRKAIQLRPLEKTNLRDDQNNIAKVFESLKLRTAKDVRDLADKNYFAIPPNKPELIGVADKLVHTFLKCIAEKRTRNMSPKQRSIVMGSFEEPKRPQPRAVPSRATPAEPTRVSEPADSRPQVAPLLTQPMERAAQRQTPSSSERPRPQVVPTPPVAAQQSVRPRSTGPERPLPSMQTIQPSGTSFTDGRRPIESNGRRMDGAIGDRDLPSSSRPSTSSPPPKRKPIAPVVSSPSPKQTNSPQPRKDSTFRPQLAKIKVEPKDDY